MRVFPTPLLLPRRSPERPPTLIHPPLPLHRASYERYTQPDAPFELASSGDVQLLSFLWLQKRAKEGKELPRRQDLPPEAFADMDALRKAHDDLPPHIRAAVLPMLSVSYCWLEPGHPDPDGKQLRHVVETLDKYLVTGSGYNIPDPEPWHSFLPDMAVFWDWGATARTPPLIFFGHNPSPFPLLDRLDLPKGPKALPPLLRGTGVRPPREAERCGASCSGGVRDEPVNGGEGVLFARPARHDGCLVRNSVLPFGNLYVPPLPLVPPAGMHTR